MKSNTKITSVSSYIKAIFDLRKSRKDDYSISSYWFFRGQKNSSWGICPNIFRGDILEYEFESIQTALRQRPYDFRDCRSDFEILTKLQHYGLGTRLLDVTLNPLVALYFATEDYKEYIPGKDGRGKYVPRDGKIVYHYGYGHKVNELDVRISSALPFIDFREDLTLSALLGYLCKEKVINSDEAGSLEENKYEKFIHSIQSNNFLLSAHSNDRLIKQSGAFVIPSAIKIKPTSLEIGDYLVQKARCDLDEVFESEYFIIPSAKKQDIREELDFLNINEATLFPELEHQLQYLQNRKLPEPGKVEIYEKFVPQISKILKSMPETPTLSQPQPDIQAIIHKYIPDDSDLALHIINIIEENISIIDWWMKDSVISRINRGITRALQEKMAMTTCKTLSNKIIEDLLHPQNFREE